LHLLAHRVVLAELVFLKVSGAVSGILHSGLSVHPMVISFLPLVLIGSQTRHSVPMKTNASDEARKKDVFDRGPEIAEDFFAEIRPRGGSQASISLIGSCRNVLHRHAAMFSRVLGVLRAASMPDLSSHMVRPSMPTEMTDVYPDRARNYPSYIQCYRIVFFLSFLISTFRPQLFEPLYTCRPPSPFVLLLPTSFEFPPLEYKVHAAMATVVPTSSIKVLEGNRGNDPPNLKRNAKSGT